MPTLLETAAKLDNMLKVGWEDLTPIAVQNVKYDEVEGQPYLETKVIPYVTYNVTIGSAMCKRKRTEGSLFVNIRTTLGQGTGLAYQYAQKIQDIMDNQNPLENLFTYVSTVVPVGDDDNGWYNMTCEVPFISDEI